jgi:hypothetical protein
MSQVVDKNTLAMLGKNRLNAKKAGHQIRADAFKNNQIWPSTKPLKFYCIKYFEKGGSESEVAERSLVAERSRSHLYLSSFFSAFYFSAFDYAQAANGSVRRRCHYSTFDFEIHVKLSGFGDIL